MATWSTLIVAGRIDETLQKEKLSSLLFHCLTSCYGTDAPQVDADYASFAAAFAKPTLSKEFGLTNAHSASNSSHLVRVQYNPTSEHFRAALREALRHAVNGARPVDSQASTDGRVNIIYVGQVLGLTGEWLLADSSLSGQLLTSWLDSDAARSWWPQLDKFLNQGDHLSLQVITPLAGTGTSWSATKPGHSHRLLTHVDVHTVQLDLAVEGSWRLNGRPVVMDTGAVGAAYDGLRTFAHLSMEQHSCSQFTLPTDGSPLGCALSADRPSLYVFPGGGGVASQASGLFALQGFTMLINGSFTGHGAPGWWAMVRNLPKLDTVVLPDWSAANVLTNQFVSESRRLDSAESHVLGDVIAPPPCALAPGEVTGGLTVYAPNSADQPHCFHWGSSTADSSPPAITLYFKLGWGELKLQPLPQRAGLLLIWTSALPAARGPTSLRILYPATQLPGTTAAQGLARLLKALGSTPDQSTNGGGAEPASGKALAHKPANARHTSLPSAKPIESSNRPSVTPATRSSTTNHIPKPNTDSQSLKKPSVPKRPTAAKPQPAQETAKPQQSAKPQAAARPLPSRPSTAPPKSTMRPASSTARSNQSARNDTTTTTTASRLAAHANLVASKQAAAGKTKSPPPSTSANATQRPVTKPAKPAHTTSGNIPKPQHVSLPPTATTERPDQPVHVNESLELAPMDPLITGWRASEMSLDGDATVPEQVGALQAEQEPEIYPVHKFEHLNEADEMALDSSTPIPDTRTDMQSVKSDPVVESLRLDASSDQLEGEHVEGHADLVTEASPLPAAPEDLSNQLTKPTVSDVLKLIDPMNDQNALDGESNLSEAQLANDVDEPLEAAKFAMDESDQSQEAVLMSRPPPFIETGMDQEPVDDGGETMPSCLADLRAELQLSGLGDTATVELEDASSSKDQMTYNGSEIHDPVASAYAVDHAFDEAIRSHQHEAIDEPPLHSEGFVSSQTRADFADTDTAVDLPTDLVPCTDTVDATSLETLAQPVAEPPSDYLLSCELRSRPPVDIGMEDDGLPDVITKANVLGEQSHHQKFADSPDHDLFASDRMDAAITDSPVEVQPVEQSPTQLQVVGHAEPDGVHAVDDPREVSVQLLDAVSHDLHVEVDDDKEGTGHAVPASLTPESAAHPALPHGFRAQLGSPSSDTSDLELNDREFWVSTTRPQPQQDPSEQQVDSPGSLTDVVINSQDLLESQEHQDELSLSPDATAHTIDRKPSEIDPQAYPDVETGAIDSSTVEPTDVVRLSADSLEATQEEPHPQQSDEHLDSHESHAPIDFVPMDYRSQLLADSTTVGDDEDQYALDKSRPIGFACLSPDQTNEPLNFGSPASDASVDSVVRTTESAPQISSSNQIESDLSEAPDGMHYPIGFKHLDSSNFHSNGTNGSVLNDEVPTNLLHTENGNHVIEFPPFPTKKGLPFTLSEPGTVPEVHSAGDCVPYPLSSPEDGAGQPPVVTCPVVPQASGDTATEMVFDPLSAWGQPQGMPAPAPPAKPGSMHKTSTSSNTRPGTTQRPSSAMKSTASAKSASTTGVTSLPVTLPPGPPVFLDLIWVPSYLAYVPQNLAVEFFSRVRARVYVISGEALHPTVGEALLAGKAKWNPNDVDSLCRSPDTRLTILPTDEPYEWACWLRTPCGREDRETGESRLQASGFHVMPTASLCDIEYSANNVAFRCEGVRVDL